MPKGQQRVIWTVGHSTHSFEEFLAMLRSFQIERLVDIRSFPGSRRYPHFNKESLQVSMPHAGVIYTHIVELGGRRKPKPDSKNSAWRLNAFKGYADYMETDDFQKGINELQHLALTQRIAYMCSEAVWWSCHRALASDYLKVQGWTVMHIMGIGKAQEHPFTSPAKVVSGVLSYQA